jgi:hypothetical protein
MKKLRDILEIKSLEQLQFYVVDELTGSKDGWIAEDGRITLLFISPAMMKLLDDKNAELSDILQYADAITLKDAPPYMVSYWKAMLTTNVQQPTISFKELEHEQAK